MPAQRIVLDARCRTAHETLPYDAMDPRGWHRRARAVCDAPPCIIAAYAPLASRTFAKLSAAVKTGGPHPILAVGDLGLGFALDERRQSVVSVEAAALLQLVALTPGTPCPTPAPLAAMQGTWSAGMCLVAFASRTGWRGAFAERRLWSAVLLSEGADDAGTTCCKPAVRGWYPAAVLDDLRGCVGAELVSTAARTIAARGFDGAPDLVLWHGAPPALWCVEVKSATDRLRAAQVKMLDALSRLPNVRCTVCGPASALKRAADDLARGDGSGDETP